MARNANANDSDSQDRRSDTADEPKKQKSRRPANTAFRQQRLKAWQPILTPKTVLPLFFLVGIIFAPIGGLLIWASSQVQEISIDYSNCATDAPLLESFPIEGSGASALTAMAGGFSSYFKTPTTNPPTWGRARTNYTYSQAMGGATLELDACVLEFDIPNNIGGPVYFYYRLTNFYQNHRRYVSSLDMEQLRGDARSASAINSGDCEPLRLAENGKPYYPCGLIANSLFNDTFDNPLKVNDNLAPYVMTDKGIAWGSDGDLYKRSNYAPQDVMPPPNWETRYPNGYNDTNFPDIHTDEAFQVWMRTAGLPAFSKLARRNDNEVMTAGRYRLNIYTAFPVTRYGGTKSILITTRTVMGGKNPFLGIAYVVVGGICIVLGAVFTAAHLIKPRKLGDHTYLTWNNDQPSTATTTGRHGRPEA